VLALYVVSSDALALYTHTQWLWWLIPLVFLWIFRVWWAAHKGKIHSDPVLFVIKDHFSQLMLGLLILLVVVAV
jgi:hypothetical protein